jgi:hypothetical protein
MRRKLTTLIDENLFRRVQLEAARQGKQVSGIVGEALKQYLREQGERPRTAGLVTESWGALYLSEEDVREILDEENVPSTVDDRKVQTDNPGDMGASRSEENQDEVPGAR